MKIFNSLDEDFNPTIPGILSVGFFETLHIGHKKIIESLISYSKSLNLKNYILTFVSHPPKKSFSKIMFTPEDRIIFFRNSGIDNLILLNCTTDLFQMKADDFINLIKTNLNITHIISSKDFKIGCDQKPAGDLVKTNDISIINIDPVIIEDMPVSTTAIKEYLQKGDISKINKLLDKTYFINGIVRKGKQLGRKIGFPTMNIYIDNMILPANGVYITKTIINNDEFYSMTYVNDTIVETNLIGYNYFHYNFKIKIDFFEKIRDNTICENLDDLTALISKDLIKVKQYFNITE